MKKITIFLVIISCCLATLAYAQNPKYENRILTIPAVDTVETAGALQEIAIELKDDGSLLLLDFKESVKIAGRAIDKVELIQTDSFPVQMILKVDGFLSNGCLNVGETAFRIEEKKIEVSLFFANTPAVLNPGEYACPASFNFFTEYISLPIYGLEEGEYSYNFNDEHFGDFSLQAFNGFENELR